MYYINLAFLIAIKSCIVRLSFSYDGIMIGNRIEFLNVISRGIHDARVKVSREIGERSDALRACALMHTTKICAGR